MHNIYYDKTLVNKEFTGNNKKCIQRTNKCIEITLTSYNA